jgi:pyruvate/2-oxoglutarate dehydrogenase complex dihydrolipoamide dehydrogenase (E3) component
MLIAIKTCTTFYFFQMSILETISSGLGLTFLIGLSLIGLDFLISWIWRNVFFRRTKSLKGKHVLITGGSKGIGKEVAKEFVRRGANVSILARNPQQLSEACQEISQLINTLSSSPTKVSPQKVLDISVDVTSDFNTVAKSVK